MASKFWTSFPLSPHVFKTSRFRCFLLSICKITPSAAITMKIACWVVVFSIFLCLFAYGSFSIDVFRKGFPIVEPDPDHTKLLTAREGLEAIERINNPIAAVFVIGPYLCLKSFLLDQLSPFLVMKDLVLGTCMTQKQKLDADRNEVDLSNHPFTDITYRIFALATVLSSVLIYNLPETVHNLSLKMSSKETGSKAREYTSISSTASNEGFGVESELVEMPASCESEIANEEMDRTLRCFEPVQLHQSGEAPRRGNSARSAASKPSSSQKRRHDEPKSPTTYLRMRADNAPLPRRRTNRSYNEQEDGIKTCASSKKPNTSTAAPLYKELKKDDYYWF